MSKSAFIEKIANRGELSKAEAKRMVELVFGEIEAGLKSSKKEGKYTTSKEIDAGLGTLATSQRRLRSARQFTGEFRPCAVVEVRPECSSRNRARRIAVVATRKSEMVGPAGFEPATTPL